MAGRVYGLPLLLYQVDWPSDMELFHRAYGEGPPLIVLHGLFGAGGNWHTLSSKHFGEIYSTYALDLRNHGSSPHSDEFDYPSMAADVVEFAGAHGLDRVHLLGHSLGGKVAMHVAIKWPDLVDHLVVADMSPLRARSGHDDIIEALQSVDFARVESRADADALLAKRIPSEPVRQFLLKNLKRGDSGRYAWKMNLPAIVRNYSKIGEALPDGVFEGPTLFLRGTRSRYIEPEDEAAISRIFPNATIEDIDAGHWIHAERPQEFADAVIHFLSVRQTARTSSPASA